MSDRDPAETAYKWDEDDSYYWGGEERFEYLEEPEPLTFPDSMV